MPEWKYHLWMYENTLELVEILFPHYVNDYLKLLSGAAKTDIARYLYVYQWGGVYFDTDFRFFQPINEKLLSHMCILGIEDEDMPELGGGSQTRECVHWFRARLYLVDGPCR